jgi:hypothetical protein|eukprot:COSAG01_NODE_29939_length_626_cov_1.762808_1_plen_63_part_00
MMVTLGQVPAVLAADELLDSGSAELAQGKVAAAAESVLSAAELDGASPRLPTLLDNAIEQAT